MTQVHNFYTLGQQSCAYVSSQTNYSNEWNLNLNLAGGQSMSGSSHLHLIYRKSGGLGNLYDKTHIPKTLLGLTHYSG